MAHLEYPRCLHRPDGSTCLVDNDEERDAKLAEGWNLRPGEAPAPVAPPTASTDPAPEFNQEPPSGWVEPKKRGRKTEH